MTDSRFEALETKVAFQEDMLNELNEVVIRQQGQIDRLHASLQDIIDRLKSEPAYAENDEPVDEKPPHY